MAHDFGQGRAVLVKSSNGRLAILLLVLLMAVIALFCGCTSQIHDAATTHRMNLSRFVRASQPRPGYDKPTWDVFADDALASAAALESMSAGR